MDLRFLHRTYSKNIVQRLFCFSFFITTKILITISDSVHVDPTAITPHFNAFFCCHVTG